MPGPHVIHGYVATNLYVCPMSQKPPCVSLVSRSPFFSSFRAVPPYVPRLLLIYLYVYEYIYIYILLHISYIYIFYIDLYVYVCMYVGGEATKLGPSSFKMATVSTSVDNRCKLQALLSNTNCLVDPSSIASPVFSISSKWQRLLFGKTAIDLEHRMIERETDTQREIFL